MTILEHIAFLNRKIKDLEKKICCVQNETCPDILALEDNILICNADGLYVPPTEIPSPVDDFFEISFFLAQPYQVPPNFFYHSLFNSHIINSGANYPIGNTSATFTMTASDFSRGGWVTDAAATAYTITWPTGAQIAAIIGGAGPGTSFDWIVSNNSTTDPTTFIVNTGVVAESAITGGDNLVVDPETTATFRFIANYDGNFTWKVSRIN